MTVDTALDRLNLVLGRLRTLGELIFQQWRPIVLALVVLATVIGLYATIDWFIFTYPGDRIHAFYDALNRGKPGDAWVLLEPSYRKGRWHDRFDRFSSGFETTVNHAGVHVEFVGQRFNPLVIVTTLFSASVEYEVTFTVIDRLRRSHCQSQTQQYYECRWLEIKNASDYRALVDGKLNSTDSPTDDPSLELERVFRKRFQLYRTSTLQWSIAHIETYEGTLKFNSRSRPPVTASSSTIRPGWKQSLGETSCAVLRECPGRFGPQRARNISSNQFAIQSPNPVLRMVGLINDEAVPVAAVPRVAIIIDDIGRDRGVADAVLTLPFPVTVAVLPNLPLSPYVSERASRGGAEVLLHIPMQAQPGRGDSERVELRTGMHPGQVDALLGEMLATVPHAVGVNNHQGSQATSDSTLMDALMRSLHSRGLFFVDSVTTEATTAGDRAKSSGVPWASRTIFLDSIPTRTRVLAQLNVAAEFAKRDGVAVAIGHPYTTTIEALREGVPLLQSQGINLVPVSAVLRR